jgi:uncharacterized protein YprB with RNaseH-like and TPR domain
MIRNTFLFLPKIKQKKEQNIWKQGIKNWDEFLNNDVMGISKKTKQFYNRQIMEAQQAYYNGDSTYFSKIPTTETWRLYEYFKDETVFLDIETSSSTSMKSYLTVIGLYDGIDTKIMIKDVNLDLVALKNELQKYKFVVTFNGSTFDIPYLNKKFPGLIPNVPHMDLRYLCSKIGLNGGLKDIEKQLGIMRDNEIVERLYGGDPLKLWKMFKGSGDDYYLKLLVEYNEEDVINLKIISDFTVNKLKERILKEY